LYYFIYLLSLCIDSVLLNIIILL